MKVMELVGQLAESMKLINERLNSVQRQIGALPGSSVASVNYVQSTLAVMVLFRAAEHDQDLRDYMIAVCDEMTGFGDLEEDLVMHIFAEYKKKILERDDGALFRPDWFRGVIAGGRKPLSSQSTTDPTEND